MPLNCVPMIELKLHVFTISNVFASRITFVTFQYNDRFKNNTQNWAFHQNLILSQCRPVKNLHWGCNFISFEFVFVAQGIVYHQKKYNTSCGSHLFTIHYQKWKRYSDQNYKRKKFPKNKDHNWQTKYWGRFVLQLLAIQNFTHIATARFDNFGQSDNNGQNWQTWLKKLTLATVSQKNKL